jgi:hypothetical protein
MHRLKANMHEVKMIVSVSAPVLLKLIQPFLKTFLIVGYLFKPENECCEKQFRNNMYAHHQLLVPMQRSRAPTYKISGSLYTNDSRRIINSI